MTVMAGIDIGMNTLRLLIANLNSPNELIKLDSDRCITRLEEEMHRDGILLNLYSDKYARIKEKKA